jgi:hypothetical protein
MSKVVIVQHPQAMGIMQSWLDEAAITGKSYVKKPFWYMNEETRQTYYDIFGCIGWPTEFSDKREAAAGYIAVVGVVRPRDGDADPQDAKFQLLAEMEHLDVPTLLTGILTMREEYGFGLHPELLHSFFGDPERYVTVLALRNERLMMLPYGEKNTILVSPPDDFYTDKVFDTYVRALRSVLVPGNIRLFFGKENEILKTRIREFKQGDPAVMAVGGLVHTLLSQCMWMDHTRENAFVVEDEIDRDAVNR